MLLLARYRPRLEAFERISIIEINHHTVSSEMINVNFVQIGPLFASKFWMNTKRRPALIAQRMVHKFTFVPCLGRAGQRHLPNIIQSWARPVE